MSVAASSQFQVRHQKDKKVYSRPNIFPNPRLSNEYECPSQPDPRILDLHRRLPSYAQTPLHSLPHFATELGVGHVFLKDESTRFGLPSFKILGASWAVYRALCEHCSLEPTVTLDELKARLGDQGRAEKSRLIAASAGNWGRAVARMGGVLGVEVVVFLPESTSDETVGLIRGEGARVERLRMPYEDCLARAREVVDGGEGILVMDQAWEGFEQVPTWVVEGYSTMLVEVDEQVKTMCGKPVTHAVASVGVGSWAKAVAAHYKTHTSQTKMITVEPEKAACLLESLCEGAPTAISTSSTIMNGMNCGEVSSTAWPVLEKAVDMAVAIHEGESHQCVLDLEQEGLNVGPCGAGPLAAMRKLKQAGLVQSDPDAVVVLFSTEGRREYPIPQRPGAEGATADAAVP